MECTELKVFSLDSLNITETSQYRFTPRNNTPIAAMQPSYATSSYIARAVQAFCN